MKTPADQNKTVKRKTGKKWIKPVCITAIILPNVLGEKAASTRITTYNVTSVTYGNITQTISGSGTITPVTSETLTSSKGGEVEVPALRDVDLHIRPHEFVSVLGPSGSGKSTLMNIIGCLDVPDSGEYRLDGENVADCTENELSEIGIRKAVGAKRRHVMLQFLCETCILSVLGGIIGLALSFGAVQVYNMFSTTAVAMNWTIGMIAIGFCAVIGILFGGYPAAKASRLQPIDALHTT